MKKVINLVTISIAVSFVLWACGDSVSEFLFDADKERQLGDDFNTALKDSIGDTFLDANHPFKKYVDSLKDELVETIPESEWETVRPTGFEDPKKFFTVQVIKEDVANAFAVPGGYFYLYTGILETMEDEAELVAVMGHEIGHVLGHHARDRILLASAGGAALSVLLGGDGDATELVASLGFAYFLKENGKPDELESDAYGIEFAKNIKVKPTGIETYFGRGIINEEGKCVDDSNLVEDVFSTHPPNCDRVNQAKEIVGGYSDEEKAFSPYKGRYDKMVKTLSN